MILCRRWFVLIQTGAHAFICAAGCKSTRFSTTYRGHGVSSITNAGIGGSILVHGRVPDFRNVTLFDSRGAGLYHQGIAAPGKRWHLDNVRVLSPQNDGINVESLGCAQGCDFTDVTVVYALRYGFRLYGLSTSQPIHVNGLNVIDNRGSYSVHVQRVAATVDFTGCVIRGQRSEAHGMYLYDWRGIFTDNQFIDIRPSSLGYYALYINYLKSNFNAVFSNLTFSGNKNSLYMNTGYRR